MTDVATVQSASRKRQRRKNRRGKKQLSQEGHYADPLSPIASTPMKRHHAKAAETCNALPSNECDTSARRSKNEERMFSPRKLLEAYDQQDQGEGNGRAKKARTLDYDSTSSLDSKQENYHKRGVNVSTSESEDADDELFSPALKLPKVSRSTSVSPSNARVRLDSMATSSSKSRESSMVKVEEQEAAQSCTVEEENQDEEEATPPEQEFNPFYFIKTLPKYEEVVEGKRPVSLPERSRHAPEICLVLDLDETLVHCSIDKVKNPHLTFPVTFNGVEYTVNVKKRPHMEYFLKRVSRLFEIVVFTASHKAYAEKLMNLLDPHRNLIRHRLYRDDCLDVFGNYLKDLSVLGRDLSKVVLVDNSPHAFGYQINNGIPIETWYDDEADAELLNLLPFLESLADVADVRPIVEKQFQIQRLIDATTDDVV